MQGGVAWVGLDKAPIIERQRAAVRTGIIVVALLVLSISLLAVRLGRSLARPVQAIREAAQAIANGHLSYRVREPQPAEFQALTRDFNNMASGLEQKQRVERLFSRFVSDPVAARYLARDEIVLHQEGHRVDASILFVDLVGYTTFSEGRDPEQVAEVLNRYFTEFADACHEFSGTVDKYIGDCAMLLFGCPQPDPEHRFHAMQAALAIRERIGQLNRVRQAEGLPVLNIRVGLSSGTVLAGLLGSYERLQYTVVGAPANLASRLCDLARPGQVLTDEPFYLALNRAHPIQGEPLQSIEVKGFSVPVKTVVVQDWQDQASFSQPVIGSEPLT
ncbi:MAG: adenylate/guanylate cyclase domain-containing protein [Saccharospirillum sp.]